MMFKPVPPRPNTSQMEDTLVRFWKTWRIAEKCEENRRGGVEFVYLENPPSPHHNPDFPLAVTRAFSVLFLRYKTMRGYRILRRYGWQAHGLPVELMVGKQLGLAGKAAIEEFGVGNFNQRCRDALDYYAPYWERLNDHLGYWGNPQTIAITSSNEYIESVWWAVKSLWEKGLLYQALKVLPYCPSCGVHLAEYEIQSGGEQVREPAICVRLPLVNGPGTSLLVLTTAPWTLVGNVAVALNPEAEYITIEQEAPGGGLEHLVVAQKSARKIFGEVSLKIVDKFKGRKLKGEAYFPLYTFLLPQKTAHYVIVDDFVREDIGAGLVHIAPIFNEQDLKLAQEYDLPLFNPITDTGTFIPEVRPWSGKYVLNANPFIIQDLDARGLLFKTEDHSESHSLCRYCGSPLLDYARNTWFMRINPYHERLLELNPPLVGIVKQRHRKAVSGEEEKIGDRALSYDRFWGAPLPIWECQACHQQVCVGSIEELTQLAGKALDDLDLHRPNIDEIFLKCPECQGQLARMPELVNPGFETGCMAFAPWHYPFENQDVVEERLTADLVCRVAGKTDDWLFGLQSMAAILFAKPGFNNAIDLGSLLRDALKTANPPNEADFLDIMNAYGADVFRWHLFDIWQAEAGSHPASKILAEEALKKARKTISILWNIYALFITQAKLDDWSPGDIPIEPEYNLLDRWLLAELHTLILKVTTAFEFYDPHRVVVDLQKFIDNLSHWYIRQSRSRFEKRAMDADKAAIFATLYETLMTLCQLCAPVIPFLAEEIYQNLAVNTQSQEKTSVHLINWPIARLEFLNENLIADMAIVMRLVSLGKAARMQAKLAAYQPLEAIDYFIPPDSQHQRIESLAEIIKKALNIKQVKFMDAGTLSDRSSDPGNVIISKGIYQAMLVTQLTPALIDEGVARQVFHRLNALRKQAGLGRDEHIRLYVKAAPGLLETIFRVRQQIAAEALVDEMSEGSLPARGVLSQFKIHGETVVIGLEKID